MNEYIKDIVESWGFTADGHVITAVIVLLSLIAMLSVFWLILHIVSPKSSHYREMCFKVVIVTTAILLCITTFVSVGGNVIIKENTSNFASLSTYIGTINSPRNPDDYGTTVGFGGYNNIQFGKTDVVILDIDGSIYTYTPYLEGGTWYLNYAGNAPFRATLVEDGNTLKLDYITLWSFYKDESIKVYTMTPNQFLGVLGRGGE